MSKNEFLKRSLKLGFTLRFGPINQIKMSSAAVWNWLYDKSGLSEVCRQIVPDSKSSCTEGSVAESWSSSDLVTYLLTYPVQKDG